METRFSNRHGLPVKLYEFVSTATGNTVQIDLEELRGMFKSETEHVEDDRLGELWKTYFNSKNYDGHFGNFLRDKDKEVR